MLIIITNNDFFGLYICYFLYLQCRFYTVVDKKKVQWWWQSDDDDDKKVITFAANGSIGNNIVFTIFFQSFSRENLSILPKIDNQK